MSRTRSKTTRKSLNRSPNHPNHPKTASRRISSPCTRVLKGLVFLHLCTISHQKIIVTGRNPKEATKNFENSSSRTVLGFSSPKLPREIPIITDIAFLSKEEVSLEILEGGHQRQVSFQLDTLFKNPQNEMKRNKNFQKLIPTLMKISTNYFYNFNRAKNLQNRTEARDVICFNRTTNRLKYCLGSSEIEEGLYHFEELDEFPLSERDARKPKVDFFDFLRAQFEVFVSFIDVAKQGMITEAEGLRSEVEEIRSSNEKLEKKLIEDNLKKRRAREEAEASRDRLEERKFLLEIIVAFYMILLANCLRPSISKIFTTSVLLQGIFIKKLLSEGYGSFLSQIDIDPRYLAGGTLEDLSLPSICLILALFFNILEFCYDLVRRVHGLSQKILNHRKSKSAAHRRGVREGLKTRRMRKSKLDLIFSQDQKTKQRKRWEMKHEDLDLESSADFEEADKENDSYQANRAPTPSDRFFKMRVFDPQRQREPLAIKSQEDLESDGEMQRIDMTRDYLFERIKNDKEYPSPGFANTSSMLTDCGSFKYESYVEEVHQEPADWDDMDFGSRVDSQKIESRESSFLAGEVYSMDRELPERYIPSPQEVAGKEARWEFGPRKFD